MAELNIKYKNYYKRVIFSRGKQKEFLKKTQALLNLNSKEFAKFAGIHVRSMTDWKREKLSMSLPALKEMCRRRKIPLPKNIEIRDPFWYVAYGSFAGAMAVLKKYGSIGGDPEYRKKKWREWWEKEGRFKKHPIINVCAPINIPQKCSGLAEFIGIVLGDGGISRNQVIITVHKQDDRGFALYIKNLIKDLFSMESSSWTRESVIQIAISRVKLVQFLVGMGLCIGSKVRQQVDVPSWIKQSEEFTKFCLRGLFDTDGCFYVDKHYYKDKIYHNCGMNFTNRSFPLLFFFKTKLEQFGFHPTHNTKFSVYLRREAEIIRYFKEISSSNPKHINKFIQYFKNKNGEVPKWL